MQHFVAAHDMVTSPTSRLRAKTAPSRRKGWSHDSVPLKTDEGDLVHIKAPGTCRVSGCFQRALLLETNASRTLVAHVVPNSTSSQGACLPSLSS